MRVLDTDVAIVGAGLAGLTTALDLQAAGRRVTVLEARDRVGGRTLNADIGDGEVVEMGGEWVGPTQDAIAALADDLGVDTFPTYYEGEHLAKLGGDVVRHADPFPETTPEVAAELEVALRALHEQAATVPVDAPWDAPGATALDTTTFEAWIVANVGHPDVRDLVRIVAEVQATPAAELSLLWALYALACSNGFDVMTGVRGGAQQDRFVGGSQAVSIAAAGRLGDAVELRAPVRTVEHRADRVLVRTDRVDVAARRAVIAVPPVLASRIAFDPALPPDKDAILSRTHPGSVIKVNVVYHEPFWRRDGLSGQWTAPGLPLSFGLDNSPPGGSPGVLVGLFEAGAARRFSAASAQERRDAALGSLVTIFGRRAAEPRDYLELDWSAEPWTRGCYAGKPAVGAAVAFGRALRRPDGPIHWAGSETATMWHGYFDGAVSSGHRAASEVLEALG
ncbi:MAG: FAD-dependent oxidoreductase [Actinomycetota bacterium]